MPAVSKKQERFMQAVAHSPKFAKKVGVPQSVGREFTKKEGGEMKESKSMMKKEVAFMKKKGAPKSMIKHEMKEAGMKRGGYAAGGAAVGQVHYGYQGPGKTTDYSKATPAHKGEAPPINPSAMKQTRPTMASKTAKYAAGGKAMPLPLTKRPRVAADPKPFPVGRGRGPIKPLPVPPSRMKSGGLAAGHKAADGVAKKGRTSTTMVKMMRGGKAC